MSKGYRSKDMGLLTELFMECSILLQNNKDVKGRLYGNGSQ